jgi:hypothetical protein
MPGGTQFVMDHAKIVDTAEEIHARLKGLQPMSGIPTAAGQAGQALTEGGVQPLDKGSIEHASPFRQRQKFLSSFQCSLCHASSDLDNTLVLSVFDDGGDQKLRPHLQGGSSWANGAFDLFAKRAPNTAGVGRPAIGADQNGPQRLATRSDLSQQPISQTAIPVETDGPSKPQAGRNHHGQAHPGDQLSPFDPHLVGLDMDQIKSSLLDHRLVQNLTVVPGSISPTRHRSLIESEGVDNRLEWTAIRHQGDDHDNQLCWLAQPFHHCSSPRAKRVTTVATAIASPLAIMDANIALSDLASCRTRQVWAKLSGRVHWLFCCVLHTLKMPGTVTFFNKRLLFHRLVGLYRTLVPQVGAVWQEGEPVGFPFGKATLVPL